jgi:hypothetical protein
MNKEKWYSIGCFALSILFLLIALGTTAWHFFHDHHGDTRLEQSLRAEPESPENALGMKTSMATEHAARDK